ncbi:vasopressin V2 receptor isoform X2 [Ambystoma mexicanum]
MVNQSGTYTTFQMPTTAHNVSNLTTLSDDRDDNLAKVQIAILSTLFVCATLSNFLILFVLLKRRKNNALMHTFMINLCISDLVVAFFQILPQLVWVITDRFKGPDLLCRIIKYLQVVGMFASSYMIVAMTFDRHQAICRPMMTYKKGKARWNFPVFVAWTASLILSIPQFFIFSKTKLESGSYECYGYFIEPWGTKAYVTWVTTAVFVLPTLVITACQVLIFKEIHDSIYLKSEKIISLVKKKTQLMNGKDRQKSEVTTAMSKTIKMTMVIVLIYVVCWAPFFLIQMWSAWDPHAPREGAVFVILMMLASLNSCTNPWIYTSFSSSVSGDLRQMFCYGQRGTRKNSIPEDSCFTGSSTMPKESLY